MTTALSELIDDLVAAFVALGVPENEARHPRLYVVTGPSWYLLHPKDGHQWIVDDDARDLAAAHFERLWCRMNWCNIRIDRMGVEVYEAAEFKKHPDKLTAILMAARKEQANG